MEIPLGQVRVSTGVARDPSRSHSARSLVRPDWLCGCTAWPIASRSDAAGIYQNSLDRWVTHQPVAIARRFARAPDSNQQAKFVKMPVNLSKWLENTFEAGWQSMEALCTHQENLAFSLRNTSVKLVLSGLIDLGLRLGSQSVAADCYHAGGRTESGYPGAGTSNRWRTYLPPNLRLGLLSESGWSRKFNRELKITTFNWNDFG